MKTEYLITKKWTMLYLVESNGIKKFYIKNNIWNEIEMDEETANNFILLDRESSLSSHWKDTQEGEKRRFLIDNWLALWLMVEGKIKPLV